MTLFATKKCLRILTFRSGLEEMAKDEVIGKLQDKIKDEILEATIGPMLEELYATLRPEQRFFLFGPNSCTAFRFQEVFGELLGEAILSMLL